MVFELIFVAMLTHLVTLHEMELHIISPALEATTKVLLPAPSWKRGIFMDF